MASHTLTQSPDHISPHQAQACLLLQKTLPMRELRQCFKDPDWKQLIGRILAKVTEVTAIPPYQLRFSGNQGAVVWLTTGRLILPSKCQLCGK